MNKMNEKDEKLLDSLVEGKVCLKKELSWKEKFEL
jgi:hypothetical protein